LDWLAAEFSPASPVSLGSVFFGGGTPSLMPPGIVAEILEKAQALWPADSSLEITLEANPTSVEAGRFKGFAAAGINRLSLGVQALDDAALAFLGRQHSATEALAALEVAQANFSRVNIDLIYARPDQTPESWRTELRRALALGVEHISLYQLTMEEGTPFLARQKRGEFQLPDDDGGNALYDVTRELTVAAGLPAYEISNHARSGAECRHNLDIWRGGHYAAIGPGAHARLRDASGATISQQGWRKPEAWLDAVETHGHGTEARATLPAGERAEEMVMMGLRLTEGIDKARFVAMAGVSLDDSINAEQLSDLVAGGFLIDEEATLRATARGQRVLNAVIAALLL
ncbi:MAG: radical SAM family heme chaperone HemW, partial [Proteobacteria bacterium]|nr:radical SAM family heme chaperone HemW [Pseudomonadota bacterium]